MNSDIFINKLNNYFESRSDFLSIEQLNSCFLKFSKTGFGLTNRIVSGEHSLSCPELFSEDELNVALMFLDDGSLLTNLKESSETLLNKYTFSNFKNRSRTLFMKTAVVLRGTRYV